MTSKATRRFGDNLTMYMHASNGRLSPNKLAKQTGIDYTKIKRMMSNSELPTQEEFASIVNIFGNKPTDWIYGMDPQEARRFIRATSNEMKEDPTERNVGPSEARETIEPKDEPQKEEKADVRAADEHKAITGTNWSHRMPSLEEIDNSAIERARKYNAAYMGREISAEKYADLIGIDPSLAPSTRRNHLGIIRRAAGIDISRRPGSIATEISEELKNTVLELEGKYRRGEIRIPEYADAVGVNKDLPYGRRQRLLREIRAAAGIQDISGTQGQKKLDFSKTSRHDVTEKPIAREPRQGTGEELTTVKIGEGAVMKMFEKLDPENRRKVYDLIVELFTAQI